MKRIAIFASGSGSNAEEIARHFSDQTDVQLVLILTNNPQAGVIDRSRRGFGCGQHVPVVVFDRPAFRTTDRLVELLKAQQIDLIVLAGFMWLVPASLVQAFPGRILNIHPALLPKFGGKGMFGHHVHEAVVAAGETESGITIHFVNEQYDEGQIIFQARCPVLSTDTADDVAAKVHALEYAHYPRVVGEVLATLATQ
ncbi:phosphoribosylglycinamide formyltransferase [Fibrella forsythiae]|uniref:Phosphoribosylglycinamide formyltransferase n=1 Tax=Fibrella forsythiae TaxID=2817061 RepID=A0ABS3JCW4_9BACT|nr:phosphoribosylglycinamide formyltransferase [Fibrella forsythiae]MBO0947839.1 phosphoribosylglycinamide formyltransferase [Fibrella forsythiae]